MRVLSGNARISAAEFTEPHGIAVDALGTVYVTDSYGKRIRQISSDGTVVTLAGTQDGGFADGPAASARFSGAFGIVADKELMAPGNWPIEIVDGGKICQGLLA